MLKDKGIIIKKNTFVQDGIVIYNDEYGNSVFCQRENTDKDYTYDFKAKLRFADENVKAETLHVSIPITDGTEGQELKLKYLDGRVHDGEDVKKAIELYTFIVQRWIDLMYDVRFMAVNNDDLLNMNPGVSIKEIADEKCKRLNDYEELELLKTMFED